MAVERADFMNELAHFMQSSNYNLRLTLGVRGCLRVLPDIEIKLSRLRNYDSINIREIALLQTLRVAISLHVSLRLSKWEGQKLLSSVYRQKPVHKNISPLNDLWSCVEYSAGKVASYGHGGPDSWKVLIEAIAGEIYLPEQRLLAAKHDAEALKNNDLLSVIDAPLWYEAPNIISSQLDSLWDFARGNPNDRTWNFWEQWYIGLMNGNQVRTTLEKQIALIPDNVWEEGPEAVAAEIERLRETRTNPFNESLIREPSHEPLSVSQILAQPSVAATSFQGVAQNISLAFETFHRETGINQVPEQFMPLHAVPQLLVGMGRILQQDLAPSDKEQALREEVGRLNARIAELETALGAALASADPIVAPAFKEQLGKSLGDWKLYAALAGSLWIVSGDDLGLQKRSENILNLREQLFADVCPTPRIELKFGTMT